MINRKITIAELQKNPNYGKFWGKVNERVENLNKVRQDLFYNETEIAMLIVLLSGCQNRRDFENLRKKMYKLAQKMEFWNVRE